MDKFKLCTALRLSHLIFFIKYSTLFYFGDKTFDKNNHLKKYCRETLLTVTWTA